MLGRNWFGGRRRRNAHGKHRRCFEHLEPRWTPTWAGIPPALIAVPQNPTAITLDSQTDGAGVASIATTEVDYLVFTAAVSGSYVISASTPSSNLDTVLGVFSASGQRLAYNDDIQWPNTDSRLTVNLTAGATYYTGITNYTSSSRGAYSWAINGGPSTTVDDAYENNDSLASAAVLGTLTAQRTVAQLVMADAQDWYKFTTNATGTTASSVSIGLQNSQGNLDLELYNAAGVLLGRSQGIGNAETLSLSGLAAGSYYARVYGSRGALNPSYSLTIIPPAASPPATIDLSGAALSVSNATTWGQTITVQASVRNTGNTAAGGFAQQWYLSRNAIGSADDILLSRTTGTNTVNLSGVAAGSTSSALSTTLQLPALPSGWTGTSFYVVMRTDAAAQVSETNETNNFGQAGVGLDSAAIAIGAPSQVGGFQIQVSMSGLTASQQTIFQAAADRWEEVIIGDLPNAVYRGQVVDDLLINASASAIDGVNGILGQAGPDAFRSASFLPYHGTMQFDSADLASMERSGLLLSVVMHEMGHVLGIGTIWRNLGLLSGAGSSNPLFIGAQATAAYNQIFATSNQGVPVENSGGSGTRDSHWRDSIFRSELMTGYAGPGTNLPLSLITVASLADMGYQVNRSEADFYSRSASSVILAQSTTSTSTASRLTSAEYVELFGGNGASGNTDTVSRAYPRSVDNGASFSRNEALQGGVAVDATVAALASVGRRNSSPGRDLFWVEYEDIAGDVLHLACDEIGTELGA